MMPSSLPFAWTALTPCQNKMESRVALTLQGPISHWHVSMVTHAFKRQDSWGSGLENITLQQGSVTDHHLHTLAPTHDIHTVQRVCAG